MRSTSSLPLCVMAATVLDLVPRPALACSVSTIPTPVELVRVADVIVRARAEGLSPQAGRDGVLGGSTTQVEFRVVSLLKGVLPTSRITFNGSLTTRDEPNGGAVPYRHVRPSGSPECFSLQYRQGAEYLLFLKRASHPSYAQPDQLTPYWAPLAPSNEQLAAPNDAWEAWVRAQLRR